LDRDVPPDRDDIARPAAESRHSPMATPYQINIEGGQS
jgi:hypothetical protein